MRMTIKHNCIGTTTYVEAISKSQYDIKGCNLTEIFDKLGQLEDFEEELGIDLITLLKALDQEDVYVKLPNGRIDKCSFIVEKIADNVFGFSYPIHEDWIYYYLKDYGKTWALTKEELK